MRRPAAWAGRARDADRQGSPGHALGRSSNLGRSGTCRIRPLAPLAEHPGQLQVMSEHEFVAVLRNVSTRTRDLQRLFVAEKCPGSPQIVANAAKSTTHELIETGQAYDVPAHGQFRAWSRNSKFFARISVGRNLDELCCRFRFGPTNSESADYYMCLRG